MRVLSLDSTGPSLEATTTGFRGAWSPRFKVKLLGGESTHTFDQLS